MIYHAVTGNADPDVPVWSVQITATIGIIVISLLNVISPTAGAHSAVVFTSIKIGALVLVAVLGFIYFLRHGAGTGFGKETFEWTSSEPGSWAIALYSGLWAFDGWDQCSVSCKWGHC